MPPFMFSVFTALLAAVSVSVPGPDFVNVCPVSSGTVDGSEKLFAGLMLQSWSLRPSKRTYCVRHSQSS